MGMSTWLYLRDCKNKKNKNKWKGIETYPRTAVVLYSHGDRAARVRNLKIPLVTSMADQVERN